MSILKIIKITDVFENKFPQLKSRQAMFPYLTQKEDGKLLCSFTIGEAFESVDGATHIAVSEDLGKTWSNPIKVIDKLQEKIPTTDTCKITNLGGNKFVCLGYAFLREDESLPEGNPQTGGLLDDFVFYTLSNDGGKTWTGYNKIDTSWKNSTEASAPITVLKDGTWVSPITGFPKWDGKMNGRICGRLLASTDEGKTWNDNAVCMEFDGDSTTCYEQRICQLENGVIVNVAWNENVKTGERLDNHYTLSYDNGKTFTKPESTGIKGQASHVMAINGNKLFALHSIRRDSDRPGLYGYVVNVDNGKWNIESEHLIWEPNTPIFKDESMADIFAYLKFGQPSSIKLSNGNIMVVFWHCENGQYKVKSIEIEL